MSSAVAFSSNNPRPDGPVLLRMAPETRRPAPRRQLSDELSAKDVFRALRYHMVLFLTLGSLAAAAGAAAGWNLFPTRYTTYALLRIDASVPTLIENSQSSVSRNEFGIVLSTHAGLIKSHKILDRALRKPDVLHLSMLQGLDDPAAFLEEKVLLEFSDKSELVKISMSGEDPVEITKIVNGIVDAFFTEVDTFKQEKQTKYDKLLRTKAEHEHVLDELLKSYAAQFRVPVANEAKGKMRQVRMMRYLQLLQDESRIRVDLARARELLATSQSRVIQEDKTDKTDKTDKIEKTEAIAPAIYTHIDADPLVVKKYNDILRLETYITNYRRTAAEPETEHIREYEQRLARERAELEEMKRLRFDMLKQSYVMQASGSSSQASSQASQVNQASMTTQAIQLGIVKLQGDIDRLAIEEKSVKEELTSFTDLMAEEPVTGPASEQSMAEIKLRTAQEIVSKLELQAKTQKAELEADDRVKLVERAGIPQNREMKRQIAFTGVGGLLGLSLVGGLITVGELRRRRLYSYTDEIFDDLPLLGRVPEHGFVRPAAGTEPAADDLVGIAFREAIDRVKTLVLKAMIPARAQTLLVTSPSLDEGKSILAWNLAAGMARTDYRVLFIDANFHAPSIHKHLNVPMPEGLAEVLRGERSLSEVLLRTPLAKLSCLAAGAVDDDARRALDRGELQRLLDRARREFDFVVIDACALVEGVDPLYIAQRTDAALLSLRTYRSRVPAIEQSVRQLKLLGTNVLGAVLTDPTLRTSGE